MVLLLAQVEPLATLHFLYALQQPRILMVMDLVLKTTGHVLLKVLLLAQVEPLATLHFLYALLLQRIRMVTVLVSKTIDLVLLKLRYSLKLFSRPQM